MTAAHWGTAGPENLFVCFLPGPNPILAALPTAPGDLSVSYIALLMVSQIQCLRSFPTLLRNRLPLATIYSVLGFFFSDCPKVEENLEATCKPFH